jgi:hypothetical protein
MAGLAYRIRKAESTFSDIGFDDKTYIDAWVRLFHGDKGKALSALPEYKGSSGKFAAILINAKSRYENETCKKVPEKIWEDREIKVEDNAIGKG